MEPITSDEMRKIEQEAITSGRVTGLELMERAGRGVVEAIFETWPALEMPSRGTSPPEFPGLSESTRAVVLCGPGNNGGDGFVVARLLAERGWDVDVFLYGDAEKLPTDARTNYERWCEIGATRSLHWNIDFLPKNTDICVDALFGTGLSRSVTPEQLDSGEIVPAKTLGVVYRELCDCLGAGEWLPDRVSLGFPPVVAVDMPSGVSADTGCILMPEGGGTYLGARAWCAAADLTVTFHRPKHGHFVEDGPSHCGKLVVKDIGL